MSEQWKIGDMIDGRYEILGIKSGGMGIVFLCYNHQDRMPMVLKTFHDKYLLNVNLVYSFIKEGEIWVKLEKHKNIVQAYYVKRILERPYIFLEFVPGDKRYGSDLSGWINSKELDLSTSLSFAIQFCLGMEYAEKKFKAMGMSFVHRDIKPSNILVTQDKVVKITDFGLAKVILDVEENVEYETCKDESTGTIRQCLFKIGSVVGTPPYMSPEQCNGDKEIDIRSDIYSFGCVLYEMLTGQPPFKCSSLSDYIKCHLEFNPEPPKNLKSDIPEELNNLIMKCLEKKLEKRYQDFESLRKELSEIYQKQTGDIFKVDESPQELEVWELNNKGVSLLYLGKPQDAIECYDEALKINPMFSEAWCNKGVALANLGNTQEAIKCYDEALKINPMFSEAWCNKGVALANLGNTQEAIKCYDEALKINPMHAMVWNNKGLLLFKLRKLPEALECFVNAIEINPKDEFLWIRIGVILENLGNLESAIECYEKVQKINQWYKEIWDNQEKVLGNLHESLPVECYYEAAKINVRFTEALFKKDFLIYKLQQQIKRYDKDLEINPRDSKLWYYKGNAFVKQGDLNKAIKCYNKALEINPRDVEVLVNKGFTLKKLGNLKEAIECYDKALEINSKVAEVWNSKGAVLGDLDNHLDAIKCFDNALEINPSYAEAWHNKGIALVKLGELHKAIEAFQNFIRFAPPEYSLQVAETKKLIRKLETQSSQKKGFLKWLFSKFGK